MAPRKTKRALDLAAEKGSSAWLTVLPLQDLGFNLNKRQFRDAVKLRYDWPIDDIPSTCACGEVFTVDHSMICKLGGFIIQRHNELRDLEAELLSTVCSDVETEPVLLDVSGEQLSRGSNKAQEARLDIHARGFWEQQRSAFFDVRVCHPMLNCIKTWSHNRSIVRMRMRKSACTQGEFSTLSMEHLHLWSSLQPAE